MRKIGLPLLLLLASCQCPSNVEPVDAGVTCDNSQDCPPGEFCGEDGVCVARDGCASDKDCLADEQCRSFDGTCRLRPGFERECQQDMDCYPGFFCALGACRDSDQAWVCARAIDCPVGMRCDRLHFYCIPEVPCTLSESFPEITCDPEQSCDPESQECVYTGPGECTPEDQDETCGPDEICNNGGRCVQCMVDTDCGPGLECNARAGRCESEDLCRRDSDCTAPLVCDPSVALCRVPLPPCASDLDCAISELCNHVTGTCEPRAGKCYDDRLEQNDSPSGAYAVALSSGSMLLDELQLCPDDDDYFALSLLAGDALTATIGNVEANAQAEIKLVAADGTTTLRSSQALPRGNGTISYTISESGTYFVRLLSRAAPTPFELSLQVTAGSLCQADPLEGATGNEQPSQPSYIVPGHHERLTLCYGDKDYYGLTLLAGQALRAVVRAAGDLDPDLQVISGATLQVLASSAVAGQTEQTFYRTVDTQAVVLGVTAYSGAPGDYELGVEILEPYSCQPDLYEQGLGNDAPELAIAVESGLPQQELSLCFGDADWFSFELEDFERLVVSAEFESGDIDLDLEAYLEDGATLVAASRTGAGVEALSVPAPADTLPGELATVWFKVVAADNAQAPYRLSAYTEHARVCDLDPGEPNDVPAQASPAPDSGLFSLCGFDEDVYAIDLLQGKTVTAAVEFSTFEGDLDLQLIHPDGQTPLATSDGVTGREQVEYQAEVDGVHFVRVYAITSDPLARYFFQLNVR